MAQSLGRLKESPSQTCGPYIHIGCTPNLGGMGGIYETDLGATMLSPECKGDRIVVRGHLIDGAGMPLRDALVEIWQADANGFYNSFKENRGKADPALTGWGRCPTDAETGEFRFETIKPGRVPFKDGRLMAPHISFWIVARGINIGLHTRMYFADEANANGQDPVLARIEDRQRAATLVAERVAGSGVTPAVYTFDIHLQGVSETVFFDI